MAEQPRRLTGEGKQPARIPDYDEARRNVAVLSREGETVARYDLLTLSARTAGLAAARDLLGRPVVRPGLSP
ncbi:hypothetical protein [uncultured Methylobacterium sp.]|uniref:hypothetical protein n=1 Tax=uncultured Methylobacterium sp. TaxID=157278 RepID=UPI002591350B|nr:hypothetical protein [uncultured Methylobacterium sp.]